ncbi:MAG: TIGR04282 family arsenosugar biosynthesis glycosyltransferase [Acidobacteriota bacterium]|nr:MAG: TIGR04282 family arsenosugar biosynthesis glycosyltransferase [Acidobacteriota bacterium]
MTNRDRTELLLVFVRSPRPGRVKTRLIARLGAHGAARLYRELAEQVARQAGRLERPGLVQRAVVDPPGAIEEVSAWLGPRFEAVAQRAGDLGERLSGAFEEAFDEGARRVVAIGTDCVDVTPVLLGEAFDELMRADAVLGPALDGGYYLIGLARPFPSAFERIPWSSERTLQVTRERLSDAGARIALLPALRDVDDEADLDLLIEAHPEPFGRAQCKRRR